MITKINKCFVYSSSKKSILKTITMLTSTFLVVVLMLILRTTFEVMRMIIILISKILIRIRKI